MCEKIVIASLLLFGCLILLIGVLGYMIVKSFKRYNESIVKLTRYDINARTTFGKDLLELLDLIIDDSFTDYNVMNLMYREELYITPERETEIRQDLIAKVVERLSDNAIEKISMIYSKDRFDKILADKIYIYVMNFVVNHNRVIDAATNRAAKEE